MSTHQISIYSIVILIILCSGVLGGVTNFFLIFDENNKEKKWWILLFKSILLSISASIAVPLFLQVISNNLLDVPESGVFNTKNYFILAGFCVLASVYSKRFLDDLYSKVAEAAKDAKEAKSIAQNAEKKEIDSDDFENIIKVESSGDNSHKFSKEDLKSVVLSILQSKYTYRTTKGVSVDTGIKEQKVIEILHALRNSGFAISRKNRYGNDVWKIVDDQV